MHLLHQHQQLYLFFFFIFIFISQTISIYIQCNPQYQNCSLILSNSSSFQRQLRSNVSSTPRLRYTTSISSLNDFDSFSENLKRAAFILAGIALALGILRICLMLCKSRSSTNSISTYPSSFIRSRIDHHHQQFKPDLPPEYAEAIATIENDGSKLPTYEELPYEQRQYQYGYNHTNHGFISTQM